MATFLTVALFVYLIIGLVWFAGSLVIYAATTFDPVLKDDRDSRAAALAVVATPFWPLVVGRIVASAVRTANGGDR